MSVKDNLEQKVKKLPESIAKEVEDFVDFLMMKNNEQNNMPIQNNEIDRHALENSVLKYDDPFLPAMDYSQWEASG